MCRGSSIKLLWLWSMTVRWHPKGPGRTGGGGRGFGGDNPCTNLPTKLTQAPSSRKNAKPARLT